MMGNVVAVGLVKDTTERIWQQSFTFLVVGDEMKLVQMFFFSSSSV